MEPKNGGPAFPRPASQDCDVPIVEQEGMSLRDYLAGQALAGLLAYSPGDFCQLPPEMAASDAYKYADAMLAARAK